MGTPFLRVEQAIVETDILSATEKMFYIVLKSFRNRQSKLCFPSMRRIYERCGISKDTAYKCRKKLQHLGIITYSTKRGRKHRNHYGFILEDGQDGEIKRVLSVLQTNKIAENKDSLNSRNEGQEGVPILGNKIAENKDSHSNQNNLNRGKRTHTDTECVCGDEIPKDIMQKINELSVGKNNPGAYRASLIKKYQIGGTDPERGGLDLSDYEDPLDEWAMLERNDTPDGKLARKFFDLKEVWGKIPSERATKQDVAFAKFVFRRLLNTFDETNIAETLEHHFRNSNPDEQMDSPTEFMDNFEKLIKNG